MEAPNSQRFPWRLFLCELCGTAVLVLVGLSLVIGMFGTGSPMTQLIPSVGLRQLITGFLFGTTGASIALSVVGKESGAHINPAVTMVFWLFRKLDGRTAVIYVLGQLAGGVIGCLPLLAFGARGRSVAFGATLPGAGYSTQAVLLGEIVTTFTMVSLLVIFIGFRRLFETFCWQDNRECCGHVEHALYHLDGPGAVRHVPLLLRLERLDCIQWIQGAGKPLPSQ